MNNVDLIFKKYNSFKMARVSSIDYVLEDSRLTIKLVNEEGSFWKEVKLHLDDVDDFSIRIRKHKLTEKLRQGLFYDVRDKKLTLKFDFFGDSIFHYDEQMNK